MAKVLRFDMRIAERFCEGHTNHTTKIQLTKYSWNHKPWLLITSTFAQNLITDAFSIAHWHWQWMDEPTMTCSYSKDKKGGKRDIDVWHWLFKPCNTPHRGIYQEMSKRTTIFFECSQIFFISKLIIFINLNFHLVQRGQFFHAYLDSFTFSLYDFYFADTTSFVESTFFPYKIFLTKNPAKKLFLKIKFPPNSESFSNFDSFDVLLYKANLAVPLAIMNIRRIPFQLSFCLCICGWCKFSAMNKKSKILIF